MRATPLQKITNPGRSCGAESRTFLTPWEPAWTSDELTRTAFRRRLRRYARDIRADDAHPFFLFRATDHMLVGGCSLANVRRGVASSAMLGYWVGAPFQRRGYTEAGVTAVLRFAFAQLRLHRVEAACLPENEASKALLRKLGFTAEGRARDYLKIAGVWRDHLLFAMVKGDRTL